MPLQNNYHRTSANLDYSIILVSQRTATNRSPLAQPHTPPRLLRANEAKGAVGAGFHGNALDVERRRVSAICVFALSICGRSLGTSSTTVESIFTICAPSLRMSWMHALTLRSNSRRAILRRCQRKSNIAERERTQQRPHRGTSTSPS